MNRNRNDRFSNIPTPSLPRSKQNFGVHSRDLTMAHGRLVPWYCRLVYPDTNLKMIMSNFVRLDTSASVPLQDIYMDNYFFFVPLRIIDKNFGKILGDKTFYDTIVYSFPHLSLDGHMAKDSLLQYLGYGAATDSGTGASNTYWSHAGSLDWYDAGYTPSGGRDEVNPYSLAAYYVVYNQFFRDNNLDPEIPVDNLLVQGQTVSQRSLELISIWNELRALPVNKYHDIFTAGLISPVNDGGAGQITIPLGLGLAPVGSEFTPGASISQTVSQTAFKNGTVPSNGFDQLMFTTSSHGQKAGYADLRDAGPSVQQLYVSLALYSLYDKRGTFGSRLIEQIRGQFGLEVPDGLLDRAEYLGGTNLTLNNVPVINMTNNPSDDQFGAMRGNSATVSEFNSFDKFFNEWGFVLGLTCFRIKHSYPQGIIEPSLKMFDQLDMYWPSLANIGKVGTKNYRIYNDPALSTNDEIFNFNEPWIDQHVEIDYSSGEFGAFHSASYFTHFSQWLYQDIYSQAPVFSPSWLKEPVENVSRTLTGQLLPAATQVDGHQYMVHYSFISELTMPVPTHSHAPNITGRI